MPENVLGDLENWLADGDFSPDECKEVVNTLEKFCETVSSILETPSQVALVKCQEEGQFFLMFYVLWPRSLDLDSKDESHLVTKLSTAFDLEVSPYLPARLTPILLTVSPDKLSGDTFEVGLGQSLPRRLSMIGVI